MGIFVFFEKNYFWKEACLVFLTYSTKFILIAILYYFIIFPFVLGISTLLLGPLGVTVAVIHSVLHVNCYANKTTRLASARHGLQIFNKLMQNSDDRHRMTLGLVNWNIRKDQWRGTHWSRRLPSMLCRFVRVWVSSTAQFLLSLVPIVGIILVSQLNVANRGYDYAEIFLELQMPNAIQNGMAYYEEFGKNAIFGQVAGILESIPILSGLLITTNYVARALWFQDDLISAMSSN
ncbi:LAMI_0F06722g1_1 [Lachancea mirantina]|uniref:LAMI_0F06722g1_1 n=1 Tax=Lachancea mirantina TaxID=1230905 RepID=A0A1G4JZ72_9SACH|nr:LAMI_0F06722g1_1 [Lachancea mirantina]